MILFLSSKKENFLSRDFSGTDDQLNLGFLWNNPEIEVIFILLVSELLFKMTIPFELLLIDYIDSFLGAWNRMEWYGQAEFNFF